MRACVAGWSEAGLAHVVSQHPGLLRLRLPVRLLVQVDVQASRDINRLLFAAMVAALSAGQSVDGVAIS